MYRRILVPLDGSASAEAVINPALGYSFLEPSAVSSLVDGLEAEAQTYPKAIIACVQADGMQTFSLIYESSTTGVLPAVADAIRVDMCTISTVFPADNAGGWEHRHRVLRNSRLSPVLLTLPRQ
jgi:hypothetical protein